MNNFDTALDNNPADWQLRAVYADWLTDHNRLAEAEVQYLLAKLQRHPVKCALKSCNSEKNSIYPFEVVEILYCWYPERFKPHGVYTLPDYL